MSAYRDLVRRARRKLKECIKADAPDWLVGYAEASIHKADYFHAKRRCASCPSRIRAVNEVLQLQDVLRHYLMSVNTK